MPPKADAYKMGTIARLSGFPPALLRAWERRHGFLKPVRGSGGHRLYTPEDLRVLHRIRELLDEGFSIGEAALMGRERLLTESAPRLKAPTEAPRLEPGLGIQELRAALLDAAVAIDAAALDQALDQAFAILSPERALLEVVAPACIAIGDAWSEGRCSVAGEHLASDRFRRRLRALVDSARVRAGAPEIVVACFPDEQHDLGGLIVSWTLKSLGLAVTFLGSSVPLEDLELAARRREPAALALSVSRQALYDAYRPKLIDLGRRLAPLPILVGGQGIPDADALCDADTLCDTITLCDHRRPLAEVFARFTRRSAPGRA